MSEQEHAKRAVLNVMAKMSLSDGVVQEEERAFLEDQLGDERLVDDLLVDVKGRSMAQLIAGVNRYEDRFFVALRAYAMAHVDASFDAAEEAVFQDLIEQLGIRKEDVALIAATEAATQGFEEPPERLKQLFERSSFAG